VVLEVVAMSLAGCVVRLELLRELEDKASGSKVFGAVMVSGGRLAWLNAEVMALRSSARKRS
jgi:hypothetical protein